MKTPAVVPASERSWRRNPYRYRRRPTRAVMVGPVGVGGDHPLRVQSMTTTSTMDTEATVQQILRLAAVGCEIGRITAPTVREARNLEHIKNRLIQSGCAMPIVADIHFRPDAAMIAADFVEKVRINPGNFVDGKAFKVREYTEAQYQEELEKIEEKFTPLVEKLKRLRRALRIGTNHGSLSDRIMNRFGDTPLGMVESAMEFVRICRKNDYHDVVFSMKASNPRVMISAYRLLAERMSQEGMDYPFHLGVTEAGDGEDGRLKSAAGIGSLLEDGIGDTVRVSLTEEPEAEIPVALDLVRRIQARWSARETEPVERHAEPDRLEISSPSIDEAPVKSVKTGPFELGGGHPIRVSATVNLSAGSSAIMALMESRVKRDAPPEILEIPFQGDDFVSVYRRFRSELKAETNRLAFWVSFSDGRVPESIEFTADAFVFESDQSNSAEWSRLRAVAASKNVPVVVKSSSAKALRAMVEAARADGLPAIAGLAGDSLASVQAARRLMAGLGSIADGRPPVVLFSSESVPSLGIASVAGALLCDGIGEAVHVSRSYVNGRDLDYAYNLLQATGSRITKTEYVSCPSCGRTLFDLQTTTERIKSKTGHLKGVKIAIMGCIVNGPGEMADADFGYVGGGPGKINLYVGKTCVEKSIPTEIADEKLIDLIKSHGRWTEPDRGK